jgi:RNA polymerase sigma factor (sigma-70 family)
MSRDDETPSASSPSAYAAGWLMPPGPEVPLEAMHIVSEPPPAPPEPSPPLDIGWGDEAALAPAETERFDVNPTGPVPSAPVIASALLNEPQQEGLRYLFNYANKSIRKNRGVSEQDRDDLLHDIYMEWWICTGFEVAALPKLLDTDSPERQTLRESIYRVFGRYRYHQTAHRTNELGESDAIVGDADSARDFALDLNRWLTSLPDLEAKIIDLYYFQHKTMDEIGAEIGMAKQRVSEIHKRALSKHPDAPP